MHPFPLRLRARSRSRNRLISNVIRLTVSRMTMLSFRVDDAEAAAVQNWARHLGIDRSQFLRDAVRLHIGRLEAERDAEIWAARPLDAAEQELTQIATWGPAEDWSDWADDTR